MSENKSKSSSTPHITKNQTTHKIPIKLTKATTNDLNFITDSWLRTYRKSTFTKGIPSEIYYPHQRRLIQHALQRSETVVAKDPNDHEQIYGYLTFEHTSLGPCIHYIYVKQIFRRFGVAKQLTTQLPKQEFTFYSHNTYAWPYIQPKNAIFNPYLFTKEPE